MGLGYIPAFSVSASNRRLARPHGSFPNLHIFAVAIAAFGGALGDGRAIAAACEGTARNPAAGGRIFTMLLLGLALIETLVLFTFLTLFIKPA